MKETATRWHPVADADELHAQARQSILALAEAAIDAHGCFRIALAGGSTPQPVYELLREADADWSSWHVYFGDERCAKPGTAARNSHMASQALLNHVPIPAEQVYTIPAEEGAYDASKAYARTLKAAGNFDMVLLGLGEDGHTAGLFPGQYWGIENDSRSVLAVFNAPKKPSMRVTLSANRLSRAASVLFLVAGEGKRDAVARWRDGKSIPAAAIRPVAGVDILLTRDLLD